VARKIGILYRLYRALVLLPVMFVMTLVIGFLTVILVFFFKPRTVSRLCGVSWARICAFLTPMGVEVRGSEHIDPKQSYVIVSNHQSHYDVFVLYGWLGVDFKWVMKQELRRVPGLGIACARLGHIYINRFNHEEAMRAIEEAKRRIVDGTSVLFFPEGTRSREEGMRQFKKGAFRMAVDLGLPILPVTITGTRDVLPPDTLDIRPGRAVMTLHPAIAVDPAAPGEVERLSAAARETIASALP
jgi:1-acyl-sn-glycerol-3-phosphate acyltransferase